MTLSEYDIRDFLSTYKTPRDVLNSARVDEAELENSYYKYS